MEQIDIHIYSVLQFFLQLPCTYQPRHRKNHPPRLGLRSPGDSKRKRPRQLFLPGDDFTPHQQKPRESPHSAIYQPE